MKIVITHALEFKVNKKVNCHTLKFACMILFLENEKIKIVS